MSCPIAAAMVVLTIMNMDNLGAWIYLTCALVWVANALVPMMVAWRTDHPSHHQTQRALRLQAELEALEIEVGR